MMREQQQQSCHKSALRFLLLCVGLAISVLLLSRRVGQAGVVLRQQQPQQDDNTDEQPAQPQQQHSNNDHHHPPYLVRRDQEEDAIIEELRERMKPRDLIMHQDPNDPSRWIADPHQFFHLHHMKTGGTSINRVIHCALDRAQRLMNQDISIYSVSECNPHMYQQCLSGKSNSCQHRITDSAVMEYCAPLLQTNGWKWDVADAMTVLRHPVDRVWSMFRFQTKRCYQCRNLTDIYQTMDNEDGETKTSDDNGGDICLPQLTNHLTRNLLSLSTTQQHALTDEEQIANALDNLRHRFTVVGLTNELNTTAKMMGHAFPWLAEYYLSSNDDNDNNNDGDKDKQDDGEEDTMWLSSKNNGDNPAGDAACPLPHANASPRNTCGPHNTHWDLPDHPDEITRRAILEHNALDLKLYEAAVQHFELQKRALGWNEDVG